MPPVEPSQSVLSGDDVRAAARACRTPGSHARSGRARSMLGGWG